MSIELEVVHCEEDRFTVEITEGDEVRIYSVLASLRDVFKKGEEKFHCCCPNCNAVQCHQNRDIDGGTPFYICNACNTIHGTGNEDDIQKTLGTEWCQCEHPQTRPYHLAEEHNITYQGNQCTNCGYITRLN